MEIAAAHDDLGQPKELGLGPLTSKAPPSNRPLTTTFLKLLFERQAA